MAQTTMELRTLLQLSNFELFDFDYKFDDSEFKKELEAQVINFYYGYEIGQETPDMFKHKFSSRWARMISYYNQLHNTTLLKYNPLTNYTMAEALEQLATTQSTQTASGNATSTSDSNTKSSDYPQQPLAGGEYLAGEGTTVSDSSTDSSSKASVNGTTNSNYSKTIEGITGITYPELIAKQRQSLIRIIDMVIEEMKPCFMLVH